MLSSDQSHPDFTAAFAQSRRVILARAGVILDPQSLGVAAAPDVIHRLSQLVAASLEELKAAEEELTQRQLSHQSDNAERDRTIALYQNAFHLSPIALLLTAADGAIRLANAAAAALFMRDSYHLQGKTLGSLLLIEDRAAFRTRLSRMAEVDSASEWRFSVVRHTLPAVAVIASVAAQPASATRQRAYHWVLRTVVQSPERGEGGPVAQARRR